MKIFCITCRQHPERGKLAADQFTRQGLDVQWWYGVHGGTWFPRTRRLTSGHVGCILSHLTLWQALSLGGVQEAIILEDDVLLVDGFSDKLSDAMREIPADWQLVWVGHHCSAVQEQVTDRIGVLAATTQAYGSHAYMVRQSTLPTLIDGFQGPFGVFDVHLCRRILPGLRHYACLPSLASQQDWPSTTNGEY